MVFIFHANTGDLPPPQLRPIATVFDLGRAQNGAQFFRHQKYSFEKHEAWADQHAVRLGNR
jgi:hypothetical protein